MGAFNMGVVGNSSGCRRRELEKRGGAARARRHERAANFSPWAVRLRTFGVFHRELWIGEGGGMTSAELIVSDPSTAARPPVAPPNFSSWWFLTIPAGAMRASRSSSEQER